MKLLKDVNLVSGFKLVNHLIYFRIFLSTRRS